MFRAYANERLNNRDIRVRDEQDGSFMRQR